MKKQVYYDEKIDEIYRIANSIETLYRKLYKMEINGEKDSLEYQKTMDYLKIAKEVENDYYNNNFIGFDECSYYYDLIIEETDNKLEKDIDSIIVMRHDDEVVRRIVSKIRNKMVKSFDVIPINKLKKQTKYDDILASEVKLTNIFRSLDLCQYDTLSTFLIFLQLFILKTKNDNFIQKLIKTKYYISFINSEVESSLINNNFEISPFSIHNADFLACLNAIPYKDYYNTKDEYIFKEAYRQLFKLNAVKDLDYKIESKGLTAILRLCFLKSFLLQMKFKDLVETERDFRKIINGETNMKAFKNNDISKELLLRMFDDLDKDLEEKIVKVKYR